MFPLLPIRKRFKILTIALTAFAKTVSQSLVPVIKAVVGRLAGSVDFQRNEFRRKELQDIIPQGSGKGLKKASHWKLGLD